MSEDQRKIGEGSLRAWVRQGHKELAQTLPAFKDSVHVVEEPGMWHNPTTYDVSKQTGAVQDKTDSLPIKSPIKEPEREAEHEP